jgi:hypothetical protein
VRIFPQLLKSLWQDVCIDGCFLSPKATFALFPSCRFSKLFGRGLSHGVCAEGKPKFRVIPIRIGFSMLTGISNECVVHFSTGSGQNPETRLPTLSLYLPYSRKSKPKFSAALRRNRSRHANSCISARVSSPKHLWKHRLDDLIHIPGVAVSP